MSGDRINPQNNQVKFNSNSIARELDAKDGKIDGKIQKNIWNEYAEEQGGNKIKNFINIDNAIASINTYNARDEEIAQKVKEQIKFTFTSPEINSDFPSELKPNNPAHEQQLKDIAEMKKASQNMGVDIPKETPTLNAEEKLMAALNPEEINGGMALAQDVTITGNKNKVRIGAEIPRETLSLNAEEKLMAALAHEEKINVSKDLAQADIQKNENDV